jgi:putative ABC transport system substrate-binding protein
LREAIPTAAKVGFLGSSKLSDSPLVRTLREAAQQLGISILGPLMEGPIQDEEYRRVVGGMAQEHIDGVIINDQAEHFVHRQLIVDLMHSAKLPAIFPYREYCEIGALMAYGGSILENYRREAI